MCPPLICQMGFLRVIQHPTVHPVAPSVRSRWATGCRGPKCRGITIGALLLCGSQPLASDGRILCTHRPQRPVLAVHIRCRVYFVPFPGGCLLLLLLLLRRRSGRNGCRVVDAEADRPMGAAGLTPYSSSSSGGK